MSQFDPQSFLDATLTDPTEKRNPLPIGDYLAVLGEVTARTWTSKTDSSRSGIAWDVPLTIEVPAEIQDSAKLPPTITLKGGIMLDVTADGMIDNAPGRNRGLRMYREALDMNKPGEPFSARLMQGRVLKVKISHEIYHNAAVEKVDGVVKA